MSHYNPIHDSGGVLWVHVGRPCVCPSVRQSYIQHFVLMKTEKTKKKTKKKKNKTKQKPPPPTQKTFILLIAVYI